MPARFPYAFIVILACAALLQSFAVPPRSARAATIAGTVRGSDGPLSGVFVTARDSTRGMAFTVVTRADGSYELEAPGGGSLWIRAHQVGFEAAGMALDTEGDRAGIDFTLKPTDDVADQVPAYVFLNTLPEGTEKRRLMVDCMGCHPLNQRTALNSKGDVLDEAGWHAATAKMLSFAGHNTPFPAMPPDRLPEPTAKFLARHLTRERLADEVQRVGDIRAPGDPYTVTEYDLPERRDFPHDLLRDGRGNILVTGMFSGSMYVLNPESGEFTAKPIPTAMANPRALDVDGSGNWWVLCGMPKKLGRYNVASDKWDFFDIGMYPHSIKVDAKGRAWFNGHFTNNPIQMGYVDGESGKVVTMEVPPVDMSEEEGGPVPYGLRVGPDGTVWVTELAGNRLVRCDPESGEIKAFAMPSPHSGPRRLDVSPDGMVWIPEFAAGKLARFDPQTESFEEYDFPTPNSLPYCARVDPASGVVWISQCANDAIARFDPRSESFVEFRLPSQMAFIRHLDIDPESGAVWGSYSHSPGLHPGVVRLEVE